MVCLNTHFEGNGTTNHISFDVSKKTAYLYTSLLFISLTKLSLSKIK